MKDKIERFSNGDFEYEQPFICLSDEEIRLSVETGKVAEGSFTLSNSSGRVMSGRLYSSNRLMNIVNTEFEGTEITVNYQFDAAFLKEGELINGVISIISDCGEAVLPYSVQTESNYCSSSLGRIKDLFQFANLASDDWSEAKKVFRSDEFGRILLSGDVRYSNLYRNLLKGASTSQALEEFLIAINKKSIIKLSTNKTKVEYNAGSELIKDKLVLTKNSWGYSEIRISTDASFIQLEHKFLWADRFVSNTHHITYSINPNYLQKGNHYGHIYIKTIHQTITVDILCRKQNETGKVSETRALQKVYNNLVHNYLEFRLNKTSMTEYLDRTEALMKQLPGSQENRHKELMKLYLSIVSGKTKPATELLEELSSEMSILKKKAVFEYCAYLYLKALYYRDTDTINNTVAMIRTCYHEHKDWRILWFLLYLDNQYEDNKSTKLSVMKEQILAGCYSPILYYEAAGIFNEEPCLLRELTKFEIQVFHFGIKKNMISMEAAEQFIYLANKKKNFDPVIYHALCKLYGVSKNKEILSAICCLLIKGAKKSEKYFDWYRLGVEAQLRITELYEYYMYSIHCTRQGPLAQPVLLYFIYNSNLSDRKLAYLYSNVIRYKSKHESIYRSYLKRMELFAVKMLESHHINRDLAILYLEFKHNIKSNPELAKHLPYVIYRNEIVCDYPDIVSVIVVHKEQKKEICTELDRGEAQVDIYTKHANIILFDSRGNRYVNSVEYKLTPYLNSEDFENACIEDSSHPMLLLHLFDRYQAYRIMNDKAMELRRRVLLIEELSEEDKNACKEALIDYYYENNNDELLEEYLNQLNLSLVRYEDRVKYMEYIIIRGFYRKALEAFKTYGFEKIAVNRLLKLCSVRFVSNQELGEQEVVRNLCYYIFSHNKYDEAILTYLVKNYNGSTEDMLQIWNSAKEFELDLHNLEERILTQMLFTESHMTESFRIFRNYYKNVTNHFLVRAYLTYHAYQYVIHNVMIAAELFPIMKRELHYEENVICLTAWLKYNAFNNEINDNDLNFAEYNISRMVRKGIVLPFFTQYKNRIMLPGRIMEQCYITYHSDPGKQVYLHYRSQQQDERDYITERMPNIFYGIHVKEFMLFYHETIQYYITEESEENVKTTEIRCLKNTCEPQEDGSNYQQINQMLKAMEQQEGDTLFTMMEDYLKKEHLVGECFRQIN